MSVYAGPADWWTDGTDAGRTHIATKGIVQSGLVLNLDAGVSSSYPGTGTTWTNLNSTQNTSLTNSPVFSNEKGGTLIFNGINQSGNTGIINTNITTLTLDSWFQKSNTQRCFILANTSIYGFGLEVYEKTIYADLVGISFGDHRYAEISYDTNGWQNITIVYNGSGSTNSDRFKIYYNGALQAATYTGTMPSSFSMTSSLEINVRRWDPLEFSKANVATVKLYNSALSAAEIQQNFNALRGRFGI